ncbi:hypothetical protein Prubr_19240 [Polymorphospora rubra]|uniref:HAMP domain-containing protein n=1 Tax=Polymorphospora rubra TaxID=338584 RepID=A0A810MZA6_9ACTN|nr:hypothetical protein Prubr_19240 [Polymorphospora rubra]
MDQQLPAAAFPAGSRSPVLVYLWAMTIVAAATVFGFAINDHHGVPQAVQDSQRDFSSRIGRAMNLASNRAIDEFDRRVTRFQTGPRPADTEILSSAVGDRQTWTGAAIVEAASRRKVSESGVPVPIDQLPPESLSTITLLPLTTTDGPVLVRIVPFDDGRALVGLQPLTMRNLRLNVEGRHGIFMIMPDGVSTLMQGVDTVPSEQLTKVFGELPADGPSRARVFAVQEWSDRQLLAATAPVGDTGIRVVSVVVATTGDGTSTTRGFVLAVTLLLVAVLSATLMHHSLSRPIQTVLPLAKDDACGVEVKPTGRLWTAEANRVVDALTRPAVETARRWRPTALQGLVAAAVVTLLWPTVVLLSSQSSDAQPDVPVQLLYDVENRAEAVAEQLGNALETGLRTVSLVTSGSDSTAPADMGEALARGLADEHRLRGLFLVEADGRVSESAGRRSLREQTPLPGTGGIQLDRSIERLPVVYAYRTRTDGRAVVGEFDIDYLVGLMRQVAGRARVVDQDLRTVLDSNGFRAFQPVTDVAAAEVVVEALAGGTVGRSRDAEGQPLLIAAAGLTEASSAHLDWVIVVENDIALLHLPVVVTKRWSLLVAGAVLGIVLLTLAWQFYIFVQPLRRVAAAADRINRGVLDQPITPQRHDDIGAIAVCLEISRQIRHTGSARFGGALRVRGSEADLTTVMPKVRRDSRHARGVKV